MVPVIAIVGRPNVGKSTLFNRLTKRRDALVADQPGITRDRIYGEGRFEDSCFIVIDTGGIGDEETDIDEHMASQSQRAIDEADAIFFMVDGRSGVTAADEILADRFRELKKPLWLVVNKTDGVDPDIAMADFYGLGLGEPVAISASHGRGVNILLENILPELIKGQEQFQPENTKGIQMAIVGRPNVGKSTLVNRLLGEERVVVFDQPGTTRDSVHIPFERQGQDYTIIDTAGVRKRARVNLAIEKFSIIKTLQAVESAHVVIFLVDAREGIVDQDLHLLDFVLQAGKSLVIAVNKWDGMEQEDKERVRGELQRRLVFADFAEMFFISALHGSNVGHLLDAVNDAYDSSMKTLNTPDLTRLLEEAIVKHQPPMIQGRRIKLRYAHTGGHNPPIIVIHGNQVKHIPDSYKRYLMKFYRKALKMVGTPIHLVFKSSENPFAGQRNKLTPRQEQKRKRLMKHIKKKK